MRAIAESGARSNARHSYTIGSAADQNTELVARRTSTGRIWTKPSGLSPPRLTDNALNDLPGSTCKCTGTSSVASTTQKYIGELSGVWLATFGLGNIFSSND